MQNSGLNGVGGGCGLGPQLIGEKIEVNQRQLHVIKELGEGKYELRMSSD